MTRRDAPINPPAGPLLIVLSGLSGAGKDAVLNRLRGSRYPLEFIVTLTTRPRRPGEEDGYHYRFTTEADFKAMIEGGGLLEWASVYSNLYGVPKEPVRQALQAGKDVIIKVDVQGAATIKKLLPEAVFIFLATPSMEDLASRLRQRRTESPAELELRLKTAASEMEKLPLFDYMVLNREGELERAAADIEAIIGAEKRRVRPRRLTV